MTDRSKDKNRQDNLFRAAVSDVQRLEQNRVAPFRAPRKPVPEQSLRDAREVMQSLLCDGHDHADIETGEELLYVRSGVQPSVSRKLRLGHYAIEAELDLHGHRAPEAHALTKQFLREARLAGRRCVRIIHGKGLGSEHKLPVLKEKVGFWLRRRDEVLAFCSATPKDGGTGAIYVLLKKRK